MTYRDLCTDCIEIQSEIVFCFYDYTKEERTIITAEQAADLEIKYLYCENDALYIEVEVDE